jgi:hypothetical protein
MSRSSRKPYRAAISVANRQTDVFRQKASKIARRFGCFCFPCKWSNGTPGCNLQKVSKTKRTCIHTRIRFNFGQKSQSNAYLFTTGKENQNLLFQVCLQEWEQYIQLLRQINNHVFLDQLLRCSCIRRVMNGNVLRILEIYFIVRTF